MMVLIADRALFGDERIASELDELVGYDDAVAPDKYSVTKHQAPSGADLKRASIRERDALADDQLAIDD
jgi:hypothetical protein